MENTSQKSQPDFMKALRAKIMNVGDTLVLERHFKAGLDAIEKQKPDLLFSAIAGIKNVKFHSEESITQQVREFAYDEMDFSTRDVYSALNYSSTQQKASVRKALSRLAEEKVIEPVGRGRYRVIQGELLEMTIKPIEQITDVPIDWPLGIHNWYITYPKSVAIIAGTKDAGKTAFVMDFIKRNMMRHDIRYFNSEMGENEFSMRLHDHKDIRVDQWNFHAYERSDSFADVIFPNSINIVDYIEENENLMLMGDKIKRIHEKLDQGVAIICLQKDFGATLGRGRAFTLQRPRLYITMEHNPIENYGTAKCLAAKSKRKGDDGLAGKEIEYRVTGGWKFMKTMPDWIRMIDDPYGKGYQKGSGRG